MTNAMVLPGLQASWPLLSCLTLAGRVAMAAPSGCRPWVGDHGPAIPTRKEVLGPNQQAGKWGVKEMCIWPPADSVNRRKYTCGGPQ